MSGALQFDQAFQSIVAIDHPAIEVIQIRGREAAAVKRHERPQLRRDDRNHIKNHPFRPTVGLEEGLDDFQPLDVLLALGFRPGCKKIFANLDALRFKVEVLKHLLESFGTDLGPERVRAEIVDRREIFLFGNKLVFS